MLGEAALIVAAPVYHVRPPASLICVSEKLNHVFLKNPYVHERKKLSAAISVGGSGYDGWTSLGLPIIHLFLQHFSTIVDQIQINHCADKGAALTPDNQWAIDRSRQLGHSLVKAMDLPFEKCQVCRRRITYFLPGLPLQRLLSRKRTT